MGLFMDQCASLGTLVGRMRRTNHDVDFSFSILEFVFGRLQHRELVAGRRHGKGLCYGKECGEKGNEFHTDVGRYLFGKERCVSVGDDVVMAA